MAKYIWEKEQWWTFIWDGNRLLNPLSQARRRQGLLLARADLLELKSEADLYVEEAFQTSAIEGESLGREDIRSSVARRLGLSEKGQKEIHRGSEGLVSLLVDATRNFKQPLTEDRLHGWHAGLFPTGRSGIRKITVGAYRNSKTPMEVISGPMGREKVHYEAPPSAQIDSEMSRFLIWFNDPPADLDGLLRAAIAHFWFVSIHPYEDGNGRLARAITDLALAQDEKSSRRLYSLSSQIVATRKGYYEILESCQRDKKDFTEWLLWFIEVFVEALAASQNLINKVDYISRFYRHIQNLALNERQNKVVRKLLEFYPDGYEGGLTNRKYVSLTKVSSETAKRDLTDLVNKGILLRNDAGGRSLSYRLNDVTFGLSESN